MPRIAAFVIVTQSLACARRYDAPLGTAARPKPEKYEPLPPPWGLPRSRGFRALEREESQAGREVHVRKAERAGSGAGGSPAARSKPARKPQSRRASENAADSNACAPTGAATGRWSNGPRGVGYARDSRRETRRLSRSDMGATCAPHTTTCMARSSRSVELTSHAGLY